jgi:hypothetical protein
MKNRSSVIWLSKGRLIDEEDLSVTAMLLDLGALDSVDYFADGELRCVVATEDSNKEPLRALLWSNGFIEEDTEIASYTGCTNLDAALVLGRFLGEKAAHVNLVIHRDRDYLSEGAAGQFIEKLNSGGVRPFLTQHNDIESYFLNPEHLHALNPAIELERIRALVIQATDDTQDLSVKAIVNQRTLEAFRERRESGRQPDHGEIAVRAVSDYMANPEKLRRGKVVIGRLQTLLQQEMSANPRIFLPTQFLESEPIKSLAREIWPPSSVQG